MENSPEPKAEAPRADVPPAAAGDEVTAAYETVRLELKVEELERRLKARAIELETEMRGKERLRERVLELTKRLDELQDTAAALHREATSSTSRAHELEDTLRIASEARKQLGDALDAERGRREAAEKAAADAAAALEAARARGSLSSEEVAQLKADAKRARAEAAQARLKAEGHATHMDSLRAERDEVKSDLEAALREVAAARAEATVAKAAAEAAAAAFEADLRRAREDTRTAMDNAEQIRREGVESFERARDLQARFEIDVAGHKRDAERLKAELRERADRELDELRRSLDAERARLYADLELERRAAESARRRAPTEAPAPAEERDDARRDEIRREADAYLKPEPAAPPAIVEPDPAAHPQWDDEIRLMLWIAIGVGLIALAVTGTLLAKG